MAPSRMRDRVAQCIRAGQSESCGLATALPDASSKRRANRGALWLAAALVFAPISAALPATPGNGSASAGSQSWRTYVQRIENRAAGTAAVKSAQAGVNAGKDKESAAAWDTGLTLSGSYTDYPSGGGTGGDSSFTDLERHAEARVNWEALDFLAHRPERVAGAQAEVQAAQAGVLETKQQSAAELLDKSVGAWAARMQRRALRHALDNIREARQGLKGLRDHALPPSLTQAASDASEQSLTLQSDIEQRLAALPDVGNDVPAPPDNYTLLPEQPPSDSRAQQVAARTPASKRLQAQAKSYENQISPWAQHVSLNVYAGYVQNKVRSNSSTQSGPEVGAKLSIPLGSGGSDGANSHWKAQQQKLAAQAAVHEQLRNLTALRREWASAVAGIHSAEAGLRDKVQALNRMEARSQAGAGKKAPEPWQVQLEGARFWSAVANLWKLRGRWVQSVATWSLYDPDYIAGRTQPGSSSQEPGLCAPLPSCPRT